MVNIKKFVAAGPLENDIRKPRFSHGVAKPLGTRLWTQQKFGVTVKTKRDIGHPQGLGFGFPPPKKIFDYPKCKDGFMGRENRRYWMLTATGKKIRITEKQYEALQGW